MKKSLVAHIIIMVMAVAAASFISSILLTEQNKLSATRIKLGQKSACGFNKFIADAQWMLLINYTGSAKAISKDNVSEVCTRLESIIRNDPDFEKAYELGSLMISSAAPEKAVDLLKIGCDNPRLKSNWKIPYLAGFILSHNIDKKAVPALTAKLKMDAEGFFEMAASRSYPEPYKIVISCLMREKAAKIGKTWKAKNSKETIRIVNSKHALLCAWIDGTGDASYDKPDDMSFYSFVRNSTEIKKMLFDIAANLKKEYPDDPNVAKTVNEMKSSFCNGQNYCEKCLSAYAYGDKYCSSCGEKVVVGDVCEKCGTARKGAYCSECGIPKLEPANYSASR